MLPRDNLKFRSSKTAGNVPKTPILLILSLSAVYMAKIGSARTRSCQGERNFFAPFETAILVSISYSLFHN